MAGTSFGYRVEWFLEGELFLSRSSPPAAFFITGRRC